MRRLPTVCSFVLLSFLSGCAGHFVVKPTVPGSNLEGFRYYLPKPFLLVTNMAVAPDDSSASPQKQPDQSAPGSGGATKPKDATAPPSKADVPPGSVVTVKIVWLPDTAHPYSVSVAGAGIGTFKGGLQLTKGWMLTNVSEESDAKVAETITAVSGLISSVLSPGGAKSPKSLEGKPAAAVPFLYLFEIDPYNHSLTKVDTSSLDKAMADIVEHSSSTPPLEK